jgi:hypothetical protein
MLGGFASSGNERLEPADAKAFTRAACVESKFSEQEFE